MTTLPAAEVSQHLRSVSCRLSVAWLGRKEQKTLRENDFVSAKRHAREKHDSISL